MNTPDNSAPHPLGESVSHARRREGISERRQLPMVRETVAQNFSTDSSQVQHVVPED